MRSALVMLALPAALLAAPQAPSDFLDEVVCPDNTRCISPGRCVDNNALQLPSDGAGLSDLRSTGVDIGFDSCAGGLRICCPVDESLPEEEPGFGQQTCEELDGYVCVEEGRCRGGHVAVAGDGDGSVLGVFGDDGAGSLEVRQASVEINPPMSMCRGDLQVCCREEDVRDAPVTPVDSMRTDLDNNLTVRYQPSCGRHNVDGVGIRIAEAESTQFAEWPHMCLLFSGPATTSFNTFQCGASLIAPSLVVTAAHCIEDDSPEESYMVRCGEWDTKGSREFYPHQDRTVRKVTIHPGYNPENHHNDIALVHLEQEFELAPHIDTICLPDETLGEEGYLDEGCYASGWGKDNYSNESQYQTLLQHVELPLVPHDQCQSAFRTTRLGPKFLLDDSFLCAGGRGGEDTCKGDGGGPLMCPSADDISVYVQVGVTAWGIGCGTPGIPGAYASMADALCFIKWTTQCFYGKRYQHLYGIGECDDYVEKERKIQNDLRDKYRRFLRRARTPEVKQKLDRYIGYATSSLATLDQLEAGCEPLLDPRKDVLSFDERRAKLPLTAGEEEVLDERNAELLYDEEDNPVDEVDQRQADVPEELLETRSLTGLD